MGYTWHNNGLITWAAGFANPRDIFLSGMLGVIGFGVLVTSLGAKFYSKLMVVLAIVIMVGTLTVIGILAITSQSTFATDLTSYFGGVISYNGVITSATSSGFNYIPITTNITLLSIPFGVLLFNGFNYSSTSAGKSRTRGTACSGECSSLWRSAR